MHNCTFDYQKQGGLRQVEQNLLALILLLPLLLFKLSFKLLLLLLFKLFVVVVLAAAAFNGSHIAGSPIPSNVLLCFPACSQGATQEFVGCVRFTARSKHVTELETASKNTAPKLTCDVVSVFDPASFNCCEPPPSLFFLTTLFRYTIDWLFFFPPSKLAPVRALL